VDFKDCFSNWFPKRIPPTYILEQIKIPQIHYFSFGEKLAVVEQGKNDAEGIGFICAKLADFLAGDATDIETFAVRIITVKENLLINNKKRK
jgi:hypothetical protein